MTSRLIVLAAAALALCSASPTAPRAEVDEPPRKLFTAPLSVFRDQIRPSADNLPVPLGFTKEQVLLGDRIFHGEAAGGTCSACHGVDAKGGPNGNDLTTGMYIWGDGSVNGIKRTIQNNMVLAPGRDGDLTPADVDAVSAYIWALGRQSLNASNAN
jgi:hypothetical protein